jgi:DHA2 family multidrug resistance protein
MNTSLSPSAPPVSPAPDRILLLTIFLLTLLEFLQTGMIAFAAGPIMGEIGASPEQFSLATVVYACVAVSTISKQRWLVERLGWRNFVLLSLALFVLGSAICTASGSYAAYLAGRAVMGLGGAAFMTTGRVLVNLIAPGPKRFSGIRYLATGLATGIAFAPALASFAVAHGHWHGIFAILIGVALVAAGLAALALPTELVPAQLRSQSHPLLFMALASGSFLLLYVLQRSQYDFFSDAAMLVAGLGCGTLALYYFFRALHRHERPLLRLKALRHPRYIGGVGVFTLCYVLLGANNFMLPVLMQRTLGFSWETVGQVQTLGLSSTLVAWLLMSWALPRWPSAKKFLVTGFVALAIFGLQLSRIDADVSLWSDVLPALVCNGVFLILVMSTTAMHAFRDVQHDESVFAHSQQLKNMTAQFGTALGIAASTLLLQWRSTAHYEVLNNRFAMGDSVYTQTLHDLGQLLASRGAGPASDAMAAASLAQVLGQNATLLACLDYFAVIAVVGVLGAVVMLSQRLLK